MPGRQAVSQDAAKRSTFVCFHARHPLAKTLTCCEYPVSKADAGRLAPLMTIPGRPGPFARAGIAYPIQLFMIQPIASVGGFGSYESAFINSFARAVIAVGR